MRQLIRCALAATGIVALGCVEQPVSTELDRAELGKGQGNYPGAVIDAAIDVKPEAIGDNGGVIVKDQNPVAVALFPNDDPNPNDDLDVQAVVPTTVVFSVTGSDAFVPLQPIHDLTYPQAFAFHLKDVDDDGVIDYLVFHFDAATLPLGVWETCLSGMTLDDAAFEGCETVEIRE